MSVSCGWRRRPSSGKRVSEDLRGSQPLGGMWTFQPPLGTSPRLEHILPASASLLQTRTSSSFLPAPVASTVPSCSFEVAPRVIFSLGLASGFCSEMGCQGMRVSSEKRKGVDQKRCFLWPSALCWSQSCPSCWAKAGASGALLASLPPPVSTREEKGVQAGRDSLASGLGAEEGSGGGSSSPSGCR